MSEEETPLFVGQEDVVNIPLSSPILCLSDVAYSCFPLLISAKLTQCCSMIMLIMSLI